VIEAAKGNRHGHRDATMILLTFRHGLRAAEVCDLHWDQVDFNGAVLHVRRVKNGIPNTHPLVGTGLELKAHPHMLRHACGYALANKGHDTRAIQGWLGLTRHRTSRSGGYGEQGRAVRSSKAHRH
jgi:integrase